METKIDPNELKTAREWLNYLPEPIRTEAIEACEKWPNHPEHECSFIDCLNRAINWGKCTTINCSEIDEKLRSGEILPVSPEQSLPDFYVGMEIVAKDVALSGITSEKPYKVDAIVNDTHLKIMNDHNKDFYIYIENFHKYFTVAKPYQVTEEKEKQTEPNPEIEALQNDVAELRKLVTDIAKEAWKNEASKPIEPAPEPYTSEMWSYLLVNALRSLNEEQRAGLCFDLYSRSGLTESIDKKIKELHAATQQPEPQANKLPVTLEEVWSDEVEGQESFFIEPDGNILKNKFIGVDSITEYRSEKTAKKNHATLILSKIAEAQNAQVERGDKVWCSFVNEDEIIKSYCTFNANCGQIIFHSEKGLLDCIAANEQLFRDYLEMD